MKKIFENKKINLFTIVTIVVIYLILILKGGIGLVYQYKIVYASGGDSSWVPDVMPFAYRTIN